MRAYNSMIFAALIGLAPYAGIAEVTVAGNAQLSAAPVAGQISVTGVGEVMAAPDMATISIGVTNTAPTAKEAMDQTSASLAAVLANLKAAGIEARDLQTSGLSLQPEWTNSDTGQNTIQAYTARNQVTVIVRALAGLGAVLDAAVKDGANTLHGVTFGVADPAPLLDEARLRAVADARHRAEVLTGAAGMRLGQIASMSEGFAPAPQGGVMFRAAMDSVPVEAGELSFSVNVSMVWQVVQ